MKSTLRKIRQQRGFTQMQLSERSGVPQTTISNIENRGSAPTAVNLLKLAKALGITTDELIGEDERRAL